MYLNGKQQPQLVPLLLTMNILSGTKTIEYCIKFLRRRQKFSWQGTFTSWFISLMLDFDNVFVIQIKSKLNLLFCIFLISQHAIRCSNFEQSIWFIWIMGSNLTIKTPVLCKWTSFRSLFDSVATVNRII